jgi:DNA-3-methyladenine glycosylase II
MCFPRRTCWLTADLAALGMPKSRGRTLSGVAQAWLDDPSLFAPEREDGVARLLALHGIGDWTAQYIALRQLRDLDGFPNGDVGLLQGAGGWTGSGRRRENC